MPTTSLNLDNIQGNSLGGFKKDYQANLFLTFTSAAAGRAWIRKISEDVAASSSAHVIEFNNQFSTLRAQGIDTPEEMISATWVNLALSFRGLAVLRVSPGDLAAFPHAFRDGMAKRQIGDEGASGPDNWISPFDRPDDVHALLIIAADHPDDLQQKVDEITGSREFRVGVDICLKQDGKTLLPKRLRGHEHFGFKDGVSQPGIRGLDLPDDPVGNPNQGHPGQDLLWPGEFIIGYATQIPTAKPGVDGPNPDPGPDSQSGPAWTVDGSYLVFRRLRQDVAGFEQNVAALAERLGWSEELVGAKLIGRYRSGAPLERGKFQPGPYTPPDADPGDSGQAGVLRASNDMLNNNFEFGDDPDGAICPLAAHIRKAYPRDQLTVPQTPRDSESQTQTHRLLRRGIPYGVPYDRNDRASATVNRGLLFICYQNDIESHFEFVQSKWINELNFPPRPPGAAALPGAPGQDPIIAQSRSGSMLVDPQVDPISIDHFVITTGGEYFFSPSISALRKIGDGSI